MNNRFLYVFTRWFLLAVCIAALIFTAFFKLRNIVFVSAKAKAQNIIMNAANKAVINVFNSNKITYDMLSVVSRDSEGRVTAVEIDTKALNLVKSLVSQEMYKIIEQNGKYKLRIPLGTILNYEYTSGYGPELTFKMQLAHYEKLSFESKFSDAGINNVLHQIIISLDVDCSVLAAGSSRSFKVSTEAVAAQTVIVGAVPESFTNVEEKSGDDLADDIFNFRN